MFTDSHNTDAEAASAQVMGSRCGRCQATTHPPATTCPICRGDELEDVALGSTGVLYSYSVVHISRPGVQVPHVLGYVDLPENVRVLARVEGDTSSLAPDCQVQIMRAETTISQPMSVAAFLVRR